MNHTKNIKLKWLSCMLAAPFITFAQEVEPKTTSYFSNPLFDTLLVVILALLILIIAMSNVLKNIAQSEYFFNKYKAKNNNDASNSNATKVVALLALFSLVGNHLFALSPLAAPVAVPPVSDGRIGGLDGFTFYFLLIIIILEVIAIFALFNLIRGFLKSDKVAERTIVDKATGEVKVIKEKTIIDKLNASVDIDKEGEIMLDHDYDGIQELDNNLPPWWKYGFYLTIVTSVIYLIHYHVIGTGDLQTAEYNKAIAQAKIEVDEYLKTSASNVDENTVKMLTGADLEAGKQTFLANCVACHGKLGEGGIGPNLTDDYWLHSGGIADIFKSVKYGWVEKNMKSWKDELSPMQIAQVSSYIKSIRGTNPPNGKAPQGDLFAEGGAKPAGDSTTVATDSLALKVVADSLNIKK